MGKRFGQALHFFVDTRTNVLVFDSKNWYDFHIVDNQIGDLSQFSREMRRENEPKNQFATVSCQANEA